MLPILLSVFAISFAGAIVPGPILAVTLAKSYKSPWTGFQIALGHATIEIPLILLIGSRSSCSWYFDAPRAASRRW